MNDFEYEEPEKIDPWTLEHKLWDKNCGSCKNARKVKAPGDFYHCFAGNELRMNKNGTAPAKLDYMSWCKKFAGKGGHKYLA